MRLTVSEHIRRHLLDNLGCFDCKPMPSLEELRAKQWSAEFEELQRNRMIVGAFRYGMVATQRRATAYDNVGSLIDRARAYIETGNMEHLVDIANLAMIEFKIGVHPERHFHATDDGQHTPPHRGDPPRTVLGPP